MWDQEHTDIPKLTDFYITSDRGEQRVYHGTSIVATYFASTSLTKKNRCRLQFDCIAC